MEPRTDRRIGLVVVHGVGDPAAGEVLQDFTDALCRAKLADFEAPQHEERFIDPVRSTTTRIEFFPAYMRSGRVSTNGREEILAAEVFWGSASQLAPGKWGVLQGLVSLLLNVPALIIGIDEQREGCQGCCTAWRGSRRCSSARSRSR